jgi:hypothetical protein
MKAPLILSSAIEKAILVAAFLPLAFVVYPHAALAGYTAQNSGENALVFEVNSKQKTNLQLEVATVIAANPTLSNPCYPAPAGSCNPDASPAQQPVLKAQASAVVLTGAASSYTGKIYSKEEVEQLINHYAAVYGIDAKTPLCIAWHESGYNQFSKNSRSTASGVFQYLTSTWRATDEGKAGLSVFDAEANVKAAVKYMAIHKSTQPWTVRSKCPGITFIK